MPSDYWKKQMEHGPTREYYDAVLTVCKQLHPRTVLEVGTGWGISGSAFLDYGSLAALTTIDPNIDEAYGRETRRELDSKKGACGIEYINGRAENVLPQLIAAGKKYDLVYIDGDHGYAGCVRDLFFAHELAAAGGAILLDDFLHVKNLDPDKKGDRFGVTRAVREYLLKTRRTAIIQPTSVNGLVLIPCPEEAQN